MMQSHYPRREANRTRKTDDSTPLLNWILRSFSSLLSLFKFSKPTRIIISGLEAAGKTTLSSCISLQKMSTTIPSVGFNLDIIDIRNVNFTVWDVGGDNRMRSPLWRPYCINADAFIWVVDCTDPERFLESKEALFGIAAEPSICGIPLLILGNKCDRPHFTPAPKLVQSMQLSRLALTSHILWYCQICSCFTGDGLFEGLSWLTSELQHRL
ncbi:ADP-ribosylation factor 1 [Pelomyxa schiedti]|nr:ADP-ribosylation factor 1 [Pelomyxa schiedti]